MFLHKKGILLNGAILEVTPVNTHWYKTIIHDQDVYVMRQYVRVEGQEWEVMFGTMELRLGNRNRYVRYLQETLIDLNILDGPLDGKYGVITRQAVQQFQFYSSLATDGIVGKDTKKILYTASTQR